MVRPTATVLLIGYAFIVANLTLMDPTSGSWAFTRVGHWATVLSHGRLQWSETEVLANVALFVPVGFLLVLVMRRLWPAVAVGVLGSVAIEVVQAVYLPLRVGTPDDVVHNAWGVVTGALLASPYALVQLHRRGRAVRRPLPDVTPVRTR